MPKGGALIVCNHASFFDPLIAGCAFKEEIGFLARKSLFRFPIFGAFIRNTHAIPISRGGVGAAAFREIKSEIKKGNKVLIFPEGTRTRDGKLQPILSGISILAFMSKCPIIPVYIDGSFEVWGRNNKFPKLWGRLRCVVGNAIPFEKYQDLNKEMFKEIVSKDIREELLNLKGWIDNGCSGELQ